MSFNTIDISTLAAKQFLGKKVYRECEGNNSSYQWIKMLVTLPGQEHASSGELPPGRAVATFHKDHCYRMMKSLATLFIEQERAVVLTEAEIQAAIASGDAFHDEHGNRYAKLDVEKYSMTIVNPASAQAGIAQAGSAQAGNGGV